MPASLAALPRIAAPAPARKEGRTAARPGRRLMIVSLERAAGQLALVEQERARLGRNGEVVATVMLRDDASAGAEDLALAVAIARFRQPDDILLVLPTDGWASLEPTVAALRELPATLRLALPVLSASGGAVVHFTTIELVRKPLPALGKVLKRAIDVTAAAGALVLLSPLLLLVAGAIKAESSGPVIFRQRRYGYNQQPFRILKFRSMRTMEDGAGLRQVTTGDARVTRVGAFLRRTSLDELPQLVNVLMGDMSLIGPRPHALAHDQLFARQVERYGRRHAVRPGITGWAQVRGFRGETDTPDKIAGRVHHDLHYVDNWSIWLDLSILLRTLFSRETFKNAK